MTIIPFLRPELPQQHEFSSLLDDMHKVRVYSNFGPLNTKFERRVVKDLFNDVGDATTVCNATIGLMAAISSVKREAGIFAIVPSFTFAATVHAIKWCGLEPYYIDISPDDWCANTTELKAAAHLLGDRAAVVVSYATFGLDMPLNAYSELISMGIPVVIDAAPGFGTTDHKGIHFGTNFLGSIVFSFHATKPFGIGEGGLIYSGNTSLIQKIRRVSNFGFSAPGESRELGLNAKMSEFSAAIGLARLATYKDKCLELRSLYQSYLLEFKKHNLESYGWASQHTYGQEVHQFFPVCAPNKQVRVLAANALSENGVETRSYFSPPCHKQVPLATQQEIRLPITDEISDRIICLPLWQGMSTEQIIYAMNVLAEIHT